MENSPHLHSYHPGLPGERRILNNLYSMFLSIPLQRKQKQGSYPNLTLSPPLSPSFPLSFPPSLNFFALGMFLLLTPPLSLPVQSNEAVMGATRVSQSARRVRCNTRAPGVWASQDLIQVRLEALCSLPCVPPYMKGISRHFLKPLAR